MNLNIVNDGRQIAIVKDNPKFKKIIFSVAEEALPSEELHATFNEYKITKGTFQYIPSKDRDRDSIYVFGCAGSGKSWWIASYTKEYERLYPENDIYLISECKEDPVLDAITKIKRLKYDDFLENPIDYNEFLNCLVICDDIDAITGKLGKAVYELRDKLLKNARKHKVSVVSSNHTCTGIELRSVLNESDTIVFFLRSYTRATKYLLENYLGLTREGIANLKRNKSRWCCFTKSYPNVIIQEKIIQTIDNIQK